MFHWKGTAFGGRKRRNDEEVFQNAQVRERRSRRCVWVRVQLWGQQLLRESVRGRTVSSHRGRASRGGYVQNLNSNTLKSFCCTKAMKCSGTHPSAPIWTVTQTMKQLVQLWSIYGSVISFPFKEKYKTPSPKTSPYLPLKSAKVNGICCCLKNFEAGINGDHAGSIYHTAVVYTLFEQLHWPGGGLPQG